MTLGFAPRLCYPDEVRTIIALIVFITAGLQAADKYMGWQSCATSGCHGGGTGKDQIRILLGPKDAALEQSRDQHKGRNFAPAELQGVSSEFAKALNIGKQADWYDAIATKVGIKDYRTDLHCNVCHTPMKTVAPELLTHKHPTGDVSCETCHGPAEKWLLFHTRKDVTHEQRVALGMRDLSTPYLRANSCVGCHANLPSELRKASHPELRFEFARQIFALPPHWNSPELPARNWLTGQAVLLRELCWQVEKGDTSTELADRIRALHWLLHETPSGAKVLPDVKDDFSAPALRATADKLAKAASNSEWSAAQTRSFFDHAVELANGLASEKKEEVQQRRSQVLARAITGLAIALDPKLAKQQMAMLEALDAKHAEATFHLDAFTDKVTKVRTAFASKP